jgi:N-methylhydantoinase A
VPLTNLSAEGLAQLPHAFGNLHEARYGHANRDEPVELVTLRISALGTYGEATDEQLAAGDAAPDPDALLATPDVVMPGSGEPAPTPVWDRAGLRAGNVLTGPAVVHQMDSTTLVLAGQRATVTASGDIELTEEAR